MNREKRLAKYDEWETAWLKRQKEKEEIIQDYMKLSYRDRLLFRTVIDFLLTNPEYETA